MSNILERSGPDFSVSGVADPRVLGSLFLSMHLNVYGSWLMPECVWVRATNFQQVNVQNRSMMVSFVVMTTITRRRRIRVGSCEFSIKCFQDNLRHGGGCAEG